MTTKQKLEALIESRNYHTQLRELAKREGNLEEVALEQATLDGITRAIDEYARKLRK
jgi:hypothetical protein